MAKCFFEQPKHSLWNIECCNTEYFHWPFYEYSPGHCFSGWGEYQWHGYNTETYQKKLMKVTKLVDILTLALTVFEMSVSKILNNGRVDKREFTVLQTFHFGTLYDLANVDHKMDAEARAQLQLEEINDLKKAVRKSDASWCVHSFLCAISCVTTAIKMDKLHSIFYQPSHLWKGQKAIKKLRELGKEKPKVIKQWLFR